MSEIKTPIRSLNGHALVDEQARADIGKIKETSGETVTQSGLVIDLDAGNGDTIDLTADVADGTKLVHHGKNFFPMLPVYNLNGLVGTQNADGTYTLKGTYTGESKLYLTSVSNTAPKYFPAGAYVASSSIPSGSGVNNFFVGYKAGGYAVQNVFDGAYKTFTLNEPTELFFCLEILPNAVLDMTTWLQVERGSEPTEYEQYHGNTTPSVIFPFSVDAYEGTNILYTESGDVLTATTKRDLYKSVMLLSGDVKKIKEDIASPIMGKTIAFLGDSISSTNYTRPNYWEMIAEKTGCVALNHGVSQSRFATVEGDSVESFVTRAADIDTSADAVFVMGGTNDVNKNTPLGEWGSSDESTFYGALNALIALLRTNFPGKPIVFATPMKRTSDIDDGFPDTMADLKAATATEKITMQHCVLAIKAKCARHGIPVVDIAEHSGIGAECAEYFRDEDWLHPSALGVVRIANMVQAELEKQFLYTA